DNDERTTIDNDERTTIDNDERTTIDNDERTTIDDRPVTDDRSEMEATTDSTTAEPPAEANDSEPPADPATDDTDSETGSDRHDEEETDSVLTNEQREFLEWSDPGAQAAPVSERPPDESDGDTDVPAPEASAGPPTTKRISANRIGIDFDPDPGSNTLVQCGTHDGRQHAACLDLLGIGDGADDNVLLVRYRALSGPQLEHIAEHARVVKILAIGYTQQVPDDVADSVDVVNITNPNDLTRLGILVTATVERWTSIESETVVCFGSINVLLRYKSVESVFRFLHIFLGKLRSAGAISHFHVDHLTGDAQHVNTLKPLFDSVITIGATEIRIE
ncbi:MAG: DUF7504 family protein, partial [Halobacteriota archaeon]